MSNQEILEKAIQKAIDGGWLRNIKRFEVLTYTYDNPDRDKTLNLWVAKEDGSGFRWDYTLFIFNHDFAKALWGDKQIGINYSDLNKIPDDIFYENPDMESGLEAPAYKYHLQQMVISDDPIKYLGENI